MMNIYPDKISFILATGCGCGSANGIAPFFRACARGRALTVPDDHEKRRDEGIEWFAGFDPAPEEVSILGS